MWDLNSDPHLCMASALSSHLSPTKRFGETRKILHQVVMEMGPLNGRSSVAASVGTQEATKEAQSVTCFQGSVKLLI